MAAFRKNCFVAIGCGGAGLVCFYVVEQPVLKYLKQKRRRALPKLAA
jgi:hypothetical protein